MATTGATMRTNELRLSAMGLTAEEVWEQVQALPPSERRKLVARLAHEADVAEADALPDYEEPMTKEEMDRELARRIRLARAGNTVPAEEVIAELRARR